MVKAYPIFIRGKLAYIPDIGKYAQGDDAVSLIKDVRKLIRKEDKIPEASSIQEAEKKIKKDDPDFVWESIAYVDVDLSIKRRRKKPIPKTFAKDYNTMSRTELKKKYNISYATVAKWIKESGLEDS